MSAPAGVHDRPSNDTPSPGQNGRPVPTLATVWKAELARIWWTPWLKMGLGLVYLASAVVTSFTSLIALDAVGVEELQIEPLFVVLIHVFVTQLLLGIMAAKYVVDDYPNGMHITLFAVPRRKTLFLGKVLGIATACALAAGAILVLDTAMAFLMFGGRTDWKLLFSFSLAGGDLGTMVAPAAFAGALLYLVAFAMIATFIALISRSLLSTLLAYLGVTIGLRLLYERFDQLGGNYKYLAKLSPPAMGERIWNASTEFDAAQRLAGLWVIGGWVTVLGLVALWRFTASDG